MKIIEFKRLRAETLPDWAREHFGYEIGKPPASLQYFDVALVHGIGHVTDDGTSEWSTIDDVLNGIKRYNSQFSPEDGQMSGEDNPGYVALSLLKCVEVGLVEMRVREASA